MWKDDFKSKKLKQNQTSNLVQYDIIFKILYNHKIRSSLPPAYTLFLSLLLVICHPPYAWFKSIYNPDAKSPAHVAKPNSDPSRNHHMPIPQLQFPQPPHHFSTSPSVPSPSVVVPRFPSSELGYHPHFQPDSPSD